jgi:hypothetical protein
LYNGSGGTVNLIADVAGVFSAGPPAAAGQFGSLPIARLLDTRSGNGAPIHPLGAHQTLVVTVANRVGIPVAASVAGILLNVTATNISESGYLTIYGTGGRPVASNINLAKGRSIPNLAMTPVAADGTIRIYNGSGAPVDVVADVEGYFSS